MTRSLRLVIGTVVAATAVGAAWLTPVVYAGITLNALDGPITRRHGFVATRFAGQRVRARRVVSLRSIHPVPPRRSGGP